MTYYLLEDSLEKTTDGLETTYERGGSDRTACRSWDIVLAKNIILKLNFEKDGAVLSADPRIVKDELEDIWQLSYNLKPELQACLNENP